MDEDLILQKKLNQVVMVKMKDSRSERRQHGALNGKKADNDFNKKRYELMVDDYGCVNLGSLLRVTACCGSNGSGSFLMHLFQGGKEPLKIDRDVMHTYPDMHFISGDSASAKSDSDPGDFADRGYNSLEVLLGRVQFFSMYYVKDVRLHECYLQLTAQEWKIKRSSVKYSTYVRLEDNRPSAYDSRSDYVDDLKRQDLPPNPDQRVSNPRLAPKPKPWEAAQSQGIIPTVKIMFPGPLPSISPMASTYWWQQKDAEDLYELLLVHVMAFPVILISSDSSEESLETTTARVIMFGMIPTNIPSIAPTADIPAMSSVAPTIQYTSPFIRTDSSDRDIPERLPSQDPYEVVVAQYRSRVAGHSSPPSPPIRQILPTAPSFTRRPTVLVLPGQPIPIGRPYRTQPNGVIEQLMAWSGMDSKMAKTCYHSHFFTPTPPQVFEIGKCSDKTYLKHHEKQVEDILNYLEELSFHHIEKMEEGRINGNELKTELKEIRIQIVKLQKKRLGQKDKIAFAHYTEFPILNKSLRKIKLVTKQIR
ncbi:hypothetical protein Tco_0011052 [Tanacetum coccineum]